MPCTSLHCEYGPQGDGKHGFCGISGGGTGGASDGEKKIISNLDY